MAFLFSLASSSSVDVSSACEANEKKRDSKTNVTTQLTLIKIDKYPQIVKIITT